MRRLSHYLSTLVCTFFGRRSIGRPTLLSTLKCADD